MSSENFFVGYRFTPITAYVDASRLAFFRHVIGEPALPPDAPAPLTYLFCLEMMKADNPFAFVDEIGVRTDEILHAGQAFTYHAPVHAGDTLTFQAELSDIAEKKGGTLMLLEQTVLVTNQDSEDVATITRTIAMRTGKLR